MPKLTEPTIIKGAEVYSSESDEFSYDLVARLLSDGRVELSCGNDAVALDSSAIKYLRKHLKKILKFNKKV